MKQENVDKEIYNSRICVFCKNEKTCNKNKFCVSENYTGTTMRCGEYVYKLEDQIM